MSKFRVAVRDEMRRDELRPYAVRWALFACAVAAVLTVVLISLLR
jgi:hypothetical protein